MNSLGIVINRGISIMNNRTSNIYRSTVIKNVISHIKRGDIAIKGKEELLYMTSNGFRLLTDIERSLLETCKESEGIEFKEKDMR